MGSRYVNIKEMVRAFDTVLPGYAWAWHDANANANPKDFKNGGWRNRRRTRLHMSDGRCLLLYGLMLDEGVVFFNRGYLPLARVRFPCDQSAVKDLMTKIPHLRKDLTKNDTGMVWFYNDACEFSERAGITLHVLDYMEKNAEGVQPLWQDGELTRSS